MLTSPLRYPGGKGKLFRYFAALLRKNNLNGYSYSEPYAGGAGLALGLVSTGLVEHIYLNDVDEAVWAFWTSVFEANRQLTSLINNAIISIDEWHRQREIWRGKDVSDPVSLGFAAFYLNRTNRSGIIEGAGPVGGYAQIGTWRLDARFDRCKQAASIAALAPFKSRVTLSRHDALHFLKKTLAESRNVTYLDPPYYIKGSKLYRNFYCHNDHVAVRDMVSAHRSAKWIVSYDAVDAIKQLYAYFEPTLYSLSYSAGSNIRGTEVLYRSDALDCPRLSGFAS